jgi:hypothetical protein
MFCLSCGAEYLEGSDECARCRVPLVNQLPPTPQPIWADPVTVLETGDPSVIAVAQSLFEAGGIPYFAKGDRLQDLFACGRFGTGFDIISGPIQLQVPRAYLEAANSVITDVPRIAYDNLGDNGTDADQPINLMRKHQWWTAIAVLIAIIMILGVLEWMLSVLEFFVQSLGI